MTNYYPLTAAQKMHHNWIMDYGTQQVSGVSVVASVQAELDFGLLKKCIQMETERSGCTRIRFTKPDKDGNVQQYLVKQDPRDIGFKDLSGMGSLAKADERMISWMHWANLCILIFRDRPYWRKQENVMEIQNFVLLTLR